MSVAERSMHQIAAPNPGLTVFSCPLDTDDLQPLLLAQTLLSPGEATRAARFHFAQDRDRFTRGRGFLRTVLAQRVGGHPSAINLITGPRGKPALPDGAPWFNLSHSSGLMVLALSETGPVGIDIELPDRKIDPLRLGESCFLPAENAVLHDLVGTDRLERFLVFWSAKEARMKLTGEGMALPPKSIELDLQAGWPVGYLRPLSPLATLILHPVPRPGLASAICCIALQATAP